MTRLNLKPAFAALLLGAIFVTGCAHAPVCGPNQAPCGTCEPQSCETGACNTGSCDPCQAGRGKGGRGGYGMTSGQLWSWWFGRFRSHSIPETLPLGVVQRAHYQAMQTNGEAVDFILFRHDFVLSTAELTPDGKDKLLEISARMRSAPFPVLVERSENNSDPELDSYRRNLVAQILTDLGNPDADQRTVVSPAYGPGYNSIESQRDWFQHLGGGQNNNNNFGGGFNGGGLGGGGLGGGGF